MEQACLDFERARSARDRGIQRALDHASDVDAAWPQLAYEYLTHYARKASAPFISEELTAAAAAAGIPDPPDGRAWGSIFKRAASRGLIRRVGYGVSLRRHLSPTPLWQGYGSAP